MPPVKEESTPPFHAVRRDRASRQIVDQLEAAILSGHYPPGARLPTERELAEQFGTSRSSVREALRSLEQTGLVVVRLGAGGGAFVTSPDVALVAQTLHRFAQLGRFGAAQLYAARRALEPGIAAEAAARATPEQHAALEAVVEETRACAAGGQDTAEVSRRFHLVLAEATGNPLLVLLDAALLDLAERLDTSIPHAPRPTALVVDEHAAMVEAIRRGDAEAARRLAGTHAQALGEHAVREESRVATQADSGQAP